jgi:hypothetical protein
LKELFRSKWSDMIDSRWALGMITGGKKWESLKTEERNLGQSVDMEL